jgi:hypothetical protein
MPRFLVSLGVVAAVGFAAVTGVLLDGCIDTCVLSGKACNVSSDCEGAEVCLYPGPYDVGCPVVTGSCGVGDCGNNADCEIGCCNLDTRQCGLDREACAGTPECSSNDDCDFSNECVRGSCRSTCDDDVDCPGSERCLGTCHAPIGTPCSIDNGFGDCYFGTCLDENTAGEQVPAYCTDGCTNDSNPEGEKTTCPVGYSCDGNVCVVRN